MHIPTLDIPRVVIIGGGFAGLKLARKLDSRRVQTVLIDVNNYHTFQPLLYQVATAGLEPDSIAYPLRKILKNKKRTHIRMACVEEIVPEEKRIVTSIGDLSYDYLVIATGAETNYFGNENIARHAMPMKSLTESLDLRSYVLQNFERALNEEDMEVRDRLMNFVIVGGGPTGVELAGALAELRKHVLPKDYPDLDLRRMQIHVVEAGPRVLGTMSEKASGNALSYLKEMDINVWTDTLVKDYDGVIASTTAYDMATSNLIWAAGVKGNVPIGIPEKVLDSGRIGVTATGNLDLYPEIYAIGDVAIMRTKEFPEGLPMLASVAQQQGDYLAHHINNRALGLEKAEPFTYQDKGTMATVGRNRAVVDLSRFRFGGFFAWMTWLLVHLMLLVDFRNRLIVLSNWVWSYVNYDRGTRLIVRKFVPGRLKSRRTSQNILSGWSWQVKNRLSMLLHGGIDRRKQIGEVLGHARPADRIRNLLGGRNFYGLLDANTELIELFRRTNARPGCYVEVRPRVVCCLHIHADEHYFWSSPYHQISIFKGGDYLKFYKGPWQVSLVLEGSRAGHRNLISRILRQRANAWDTDYYGTP